MAKTIIIQRCRLDHDECRKFKTRHSPFYRFPRDQHSLYYHRVTGVIQFCRSNDHQFVLSIKPTQQYNSTISNTKSNILYILFTAYWIIHPYELLIAFVDEYSLYRFKKIWNQMWTFVELLSLSLSVQNTHCNSQQNNWPFKCILMRNLSRTKKRICIAISKGKTKH